MAPAPRQQQRGQGSRRGGPEQHAAAGAAGNDEEGAQRGAAASVGVTTHELGAAPLAPGAAGVGRQPQASGQAAVTTPCASLNPDMRGGPSGMDGKDKGKPCVGWGAMLDCKQGSLKAAQLSAGVPPGVGILGRTVQSSPAQGRQRAMNIPRHVTEIVLPRVHTSPACTEALWARTTCHCLDDTFEARRRQGLEPASQTKGLSGCGAAWMFAIMRQLVKRSQLRTMDRMCLPLPKDVIPPKSCYNSSWARVFAPYLRTTG